MGTVDGGVYGGFVRWLTAMSVSDVNILKSIAEWDDSGALDIEQHSEGDGSTALGRKLEEVQELLHELIELIPVDTECADEFMEDFDTCDFDLYLDYLDN